MRICWATAADYYGAGDYPAGYYPEGDDPPSTMTSVGFGERDAMAGPGAPPPTRDLRTAPRRPLRRRAPRCRGWPKAPRSWGAIGPRERDESAQEWSAGARAAAERARARARRVGAGARERLGDTGDYLRDSARGAQARAGSYGRRMQRGFFDTLHEQPLVLGAVGLAVGAAIGAALPATETEDEWMGDTRDRLKDRAAQARPGATRQGGCGSGRGLRGGARGSRSPGADRRRARWPRPTRWRARPNGSPRRQARPRRPRPSARSLGQTEEQAGLSRSSSSQRSPGLLRAGARCLRSSVRSPSGNDHGQSGG